MKEQTPTSRSIAWRVVRLLLQILWILLWAFLYLMCLNVFGNRIAFVGIPALILSAIVVWYWTERRERQNAKARS